MLIRPYQATDEKQFGELVFSQWQNRASYAIFEYPWLDPYFWIDNILYNKKYIVLVDDTLQGYICGLRSKNCVKVMSLYVLQNKRRQGLAFALKEQLAITAKSEGYKSIIATNIITNDASRKLNIKAGWTIQPYNDKFYKSIKEL